MARFSDRMVTEVVQRFWAAMQRGEFITDAAAEAGTYRKKGARWLGAAGGVRPRRGRDLKGRCLTFSEREEIALARAGGESMRAIAGRLGRSPSTISRELQRNAGCARAAVPGDDGARAGLRARRAPEAIEAGHQPGAAQEGGGRSQQALLARADRRPAAPGVPARCGDVGVDRDDLPVAVRAVPRCAAPRPGAVPADRRALRRPCRQAGQRKNRIPDMINISERPAEADDRAVPGHWEGDLIIGKNNASAIGTLVERTTGYTMLVHLPDGYKPEQVRDALAAKIQTIPEILRASLTWDQGPEMRDWKQVSVAADIDIYFCDPHAPWQRATNENTNGLLRQYFPKGTDLSVHSDTDLDWVATELNDRPRKRLGFSKPIEEIGPLLLR